MIQREKYQHELEELMSSVQLMGSKTVVQLRKGLAALEQEDETLAREVISDDAEIDSLQVQIEDSGARIIAMEQPVAQDLRVILSTIKIVSNIERIADHAKHLSKGVKKIKGKDARAFIPSIRDMAERGIVMLERTLDAFLSADAEMAKKIASMDEEIDSLKKDLTKGIFEFMRKAPENVEEGAALLFLNRFMERLGDHVTNVCEWVYFTKTGEHIELN